MDSSLRLMPTVIIQVFVKPHEVQMPMDEFLDSIESPLKNADGRQQRAVHYCSHQNGSLTAEFEPLWEAHVDSITT